MKSSTTEVITAPQRPTPRFNLPRNQFLRLLTIIKLTFLLGIIFAGTIALYLHNFHALPRDSSSSIDTFLALGKHKPKVPLSAKGSYCRPCAESAGHPTESDSVYYNITGRNLEFRAPQNDGSASLSPTAYITGDFIFLNGPEFNMTKGKFSIDTLGNVTDSPRSDYITHVLSSLNRTLMTISSLGKIHSGDMLDSWICTFAGEQRLFLVGRPSKDIDIQIIKKMVVSVTIVTTSPPSRLILYCGG